MLAHYINFILFRFDGAFTYFTLLFIQENIPGGGALQCIFSIKLMLKLHNVSMHMQDCPDYRDLVFVFLQYYPITTESYHKNWEKEEEVSWFFFFLIR